MQTLDGLIEEIAKALCIADGIDPNHNVGHDYLDAMTDQERAEWGRSNHAVPMVALYSPSWRMYRKVAARIITQRKIMKQFAEKIDAQIEQETIDASDI